MQQKVIFQLGTCWIMTPVEWKKELFFLFILIIPIITITIHWFDCCKTRSCAVSAGLSCSINIRWRIFSLHSFLDFLSLQQMERLPSLHCDLHSTRPLDFHLLPQLSLKLPPPLDTDSIDWAAGVLLNKVAAQTWRLFFLFFFTFVRCSRDNELILRVQCCLPRPRQTGGWGGGGAG